jgi:hypothetical protein
MHALYRSRGLVISQLISQRIEYLHCWLLWPCAKHHPAEFDGGASLALTFELITDWSVVAECLVAGNSSGMQRFDSPLTTPFHELGYYVTTSWCSLPVNVSLRCLDSMPRSLIQRPNDFLVGFYMWLEGLMEVCSGGIISWKRHWISYTWVELWWYIYILHYRLRAGAQAIHAQK